MNSYLYLSNKSRATMYIFTEILIKVQPHIKQWLIEMRCINYCFTQGNLKNVICKLIFNNYFHKSLIICVCNVKRNFVVFCGAE